MDSLDALAGPLDPEVFISPQIPLSPADPADLDQLGPLSSSDLAGLLEVFANEAEEAVHDAPDTPECTQAPAAAAAGSKEAAAGAIATAGPEQQQQQVLGVEAAAPSSADTSADAAAADGRGAAGNAAAGHATTARQPEALLQCSTASAAADTFIAGAAAAGVQQTSAYTTDTAGSPGRSSPSGTAGPTASQLQTPTSAAAAAGTGARPGKHVAAPNAAAAAAGTGAAANAAAWPGDNMSLLQLYTDKQTVITFESPDVSSFVSEWEHFQASRSMNSVTAMNMEVDMPMHMHMDGMPHSMLGAMHGQRYAQQQHHQRTPPGSSSAFNSLAGTGMAGAGLSLADRSASLPTPASTVGSGAPGMARALSCGSSSRRLTFVPAAAGPAAAFNSAGAFGGQLLPPASAAAGGSGGGGFPAHPGAHHMRCSGLSAGLQGFAAGHQGYPAGYPERRIALHPSPAGVHPDLQLQQHASTGFIGDVDAAVAAGAVYDDGAEHLSAPASYRRQYSLPGAATEHLAVAGHVTFGHHAARGHTSLSHHPMPGQQLQAPMHSAGGPSGLAAAEWMYSGHQVPRAFNPALNHQGWATMHEASAQAPDIMGFERSMPAAMAPGAVLNGARAASDPASAHQGLILQASGSFHSFPVLHRQEQLLPLDKQHPSGSQQQQQQQQQQRSHGSHSHHGHHPSWPQHGAGAPSLTALSPQLPPVEPQQLLLPGSGAGFDNAAATTVPNGRSAGASGPASAAPVAPPVLPINKEEIHPAAMSVDPRLAALYEDGTEAFPVAVKRRVGRPRREERMQNAVGAALAETLRAHKQSSKQERRAGSKRGGSNGSSSGVDDSRLSKRLRASAAVTSTAPVDDVIGRTGSGPLLHLLPNTCSTDSNTDQDPPGSPTAAAAGAPGTAPRGGPSFTDLVQCGFSPTGTFRFKVGPMDKVVAEVASDGTIIWRGQRFTSISGFSRAVLRDRNPDRQSSGGWRDVQLGRTELTAWRNAYAAGQPAPDIPAECVVA